MWMTMNNISTSSGLTQFEMKFITAQCCQDSFYKYVPQNPPSKSTEAKLSDFNINIFI